MSMASGKVPRLIFSKSIVMEKTASSSDKLTISAVPSDNAVIVVTIDSLPAAPDPNRYIALYYSAFYNSTPGIPTITAILRPNGTYGTDNGMVVFNKTTGTISLGGDYAVFPVGTTYNVFEIEIGDN